MVVDRYTRCMDCGESNSGEVKIEKLGYISPQRQIEALLYAGGKLNRPSENEYDFKDLETCIKDDGSIPIRDADLIDVGKLSDSLSEKLASGRTGSSAVTPPSIPPSTLPKQDVPEQSAQVTQPSSVKAD